MRQRRFLSWVIVFALLVGMFSFPAYAEGNTTTISGDGTADKTGTMTITLVIPKKTPAATDLTYTAPSDLTYSGSDKAATVAAASGVTGLGTITVKYYSDAARTTEVTETKNVGTYYVGVTVAEGDEYAASTAVVYGDGWTFAITPSTPSAPNAPTMASATKTTITLNAVDNCEYSKDGANWQSSTEFTGLLPGTEYTFYQRVKATANTNASAASSASFSTEADTYAMTITLVVPKKTPAATDLTYTAPSDLTYSGSNKAATVAAASGVTGLGTITVKYYSDTSRTTEATPKNVGTYYVGATVAEGDQYAASTAVLYGDGWTFTITASTPSAPAAPTMESAAKNSITLNAVDGCEYSRDGANWQSGTEFTGLLPGTEYTFYQRIKATANTNASAASSASFSTEADTYAMTITLVIKPAQTITASDVTATYGDTDKSVSASVTDPATGGGAITYAVKDGSGDYISVASDGKLTIKKVPPTDGKAYVIVKAAGTDTHAETTKEVTVTISKATVTITAKDQSIMVGGTVPTLEGADFYTVTGLVGQDTLTTAPTLAYQKNGSAATPDNTTAGTYDIVASGASAGDNYTITYANGTLAISGKGNQTITADNVTVTYGDTGKSVSASVTTPATGGGAISYAVKSGSEDYIDVNASTGALTIKKVGTATVVVTAAETSTYAQATKEVIVTINKANAVAATVTANNRTYDGTEKPLVTVTGTPTGGTMQYALGTATEATQPYTTSIPTGTEVGTYYVWYKVVGDANHNDSEAACVTVTIAKKIPAAGVDFTVEPLQLTYTGVQKELVRQTIMTEGLGIQYKFGDGTIVETGLPMKKASGEYLISYRVIGNDIYENLDWSDPVTATITMYATFSNPDFVLPAFLTEIGEEAFAEDTSLTIMDAGNCAKIDANAFRGCTNLKRIRLSQNCEIDDTAFADCVALRAVFAPAGGTTAAWCASHDVNFVPISQN